MTKEELNGMLTAISEKWKYKLEEIGNDTFRMDVAIKMKDDSWRYQYVYVWLRMQGEEQFVYMNSRIGQYDQRLDMYKLLIESGFCRYSAVTILPDTKDGRNVETVCVSASPHSKVITQDLLDLILYDVAFNADYLEKMIFGGDNH